MTTSDKILQQITSRISAAAIQGDFDLVTQLTKNAKRVQEIVATQAALDAELVQIEQSVAGNVSQPALRVLENTGTRISTSVEDLSDEGPTGEVSVSIDFPKLGINRSLTKVSERKVSMTLLKTIELLAETMGTEVLEKLSRVRVSRGPLVSSNPKRDYINSKTGALYAHHEIGRTGFHVLTHSATPEKVEALKEVARTLGISLNHFQVKHAA